MPSVRCDEEGRGRRHECVVTCAAFDPGFGSRTEWYGLHAQRVGMVVGS